MGTQRPGVGVHETNLGREGGKTLLREQQRVWVEGTSARGGAAVGGVLGKQRPPLSWTRRGIDARSKKNRGRGVKGRENTSKQCSTNTRGRYLRSCPARCQIPQEKGLTRVGMKKLEAKNKGHKLGRLPFRVGEGG